MPKTLFIRVEAFANPAELRADDRNIEGIYQVELSDDTPADGLANAALDGFHSRIPVRMLEDFRFTVLTSAEPDAEIIAQTDAYEGYALSQYALAVEFV